MSTEFVIILEITGVKMCVTSNNKFKPTFD